jgi:hypothetical protein
MPMDPGSPVKKLLAAAGALVLAACPGGGTSHGQPNSTAGAQTSSNWSGYVVAGPPHGFTAVSGEWDVPAVTCSANEDSASATWTGIGGGTAADPTLIQAGTGQDCRGGATYNAWWEAIPAPSADAGGVLGQGFEVGPGDHIIVTVDGSNLVVWSITIRNTSRGWTFNTTVPYGAAGETAEWIEEAPITAGTGGAGLSTLSNYGRVGFTAVTANGANPHLSTDEALAMVDANGQVISNPSAPAENGDFRICFGSGSCP